MIFIIMAQDGTDENAPERRKKLRPAHLERGSVLQDRGDLLYGGAFLGADGNMVGSMMVVRFPSLEKLQEWLKDEPFINGNVWQKVDVRPFRPGPWFLPPDLKEL